ncbi:DUF4282 domain-containing protein [Actinomyces lilanjuaniae]|uniref:DUF4282 domain-containing protein n=2 Tax=Actinomyces TaxID=1654 RepID=A0ABN5PR52_9ACTO|nr:DUF4282 domain-containing protein [Actinomyces lilanjuaniae]AYD90504.1 DUF4282 domain-containing protein [Actinomyces lilanjuaniae]
MSFTRYVTLTWARVVYILWIVMVVATWLICAVAIGSSGGGSHGGYHGYGSYAASHAAFNPGAFLLALVLGLIPAFLHILGARMVLEFIVAVIRTENNTRWLRGPQS